MKRVLFLSLFLMIGSFVHASENKALLAGVVVANSTKQDALRAEIDLLDEYNKHYTVSIEACLKQLKKLVPTQEIDWYFDQRSGNPTAAEQEAYDRWHDEVMKNPAAKREDIQLRVLIQFRAQNIEDSYRLLKQVTDWNRLLKSGIEK